MSLDLSKVTFVDDFLGIAFDARWHHSVAGTGARNLEPYVGGWGRLYTGNEAGTSRMRLGEEPGNSPYNVPNWCACKNAVAEAVILINTVTGARATFGFCGLDDPADVAAALVYNPEISPYWRFYSGVTEQQFTETITNFTHVAGQKYLYRVEMSPTAVRAYVNGNLIATHTTNIPQTGQALELQLWNVVPFSAAMYVDVVGIEQNR